MATRFSAKSVGILGTSYTVRIDDSSFGGASTDIEINGFELAYDPDDQEDPICTVLASSLTFTVNILSTYQSAFNTFIDDLKTADEGRFMVEVVNSVGNLYWAGYIVTDQIAKEDQDWADVVSYFVISAIDGIGRLKNIDYNDAGTAYTGQASMHEHLFNVLGQVGTDGFYGPTDNYLYVICNWYEASMGAAGTDSAWELTYIDHDAFYSIDNEGNYEYMSCYDVLSQMCRIMLSRFYLANGVYRIDQISEYPNATVTIHRYYKSATKSAASAGQALEATEVSDNYVRLGAVGGKNLYFAPARNIKLSFKHRNDRNLLPGAAWSSNADPALTSDAFGPNGARLWIQGQVNARVDYATDSLFRPGMVLLEMQVSFQYPALAPTTYQYLKRTWSGRPGQPGYAYNPAEWTTNSADRVYIFLEPQQFDNVGGTTIIDIETPEIVPAASVDQVTANVDVNFSAYYIYAAGPNGLTLVSGSLYTGYFDFSGTYIRVVSSDESQLTDTTVYEKTNADTPNASLTVEYETVIGDAPDTYLTTNSLLVYDGAEYVQSSSWTKTTTGTGQLIQELLLQEMMKFRKASLERYEGSAHGQGLQAWHLMELTTGNKYALLQASYNSKQETWTGNWFFVGVADAVSGPATEPPVHLRTGAPIGSPPGIQPNYNQVRGLPSTQQPVAQLVPGGGQIVTTIAQDIPAGGAITSIDIYPMCADNMLRNGDTINIYDPTTGNTFEFTVSADTAAGATSVSVSSDTPDVDLYDGALVVVDTCTFVDNIQDSGRPVRYSQTFVSAGNPVLTVTENGGVLPANTAEIEVYYGATPIFETDDWTVSGSDVTLAWNPEAGVKIRVFFWG